MNKPLKDFSTPPPFFFFSAQSPTMDFCCFVNLQGHFKSLLVHWQSAKKKTKQVRNVQDSTPPFKCHSSDLPLSLRADCTLRQGFVVAAMSEHGTCGCHRDWELADWFMGTYKPTKPEDICIRLYPECSFHLSLSNSHASESLCMVQNSLFLLG